MDERCPAGEVWMWVEPDPLDYPHPVYRTITRKEILDSYWPWWSTLLWGAGKILHAVEEECINDFMVVYWAWRVKDDDNILD